MNSLAFQWNSIAFTRGTTPGLKLFNPFLFIQNLKFKIQNRITFCSGLLVAQSFYILHFTLV